ncbi:MAG: hypothetical protein ABG776_16720 [Cyanobacteria bacterium J06555_13]
MSPFFGLFDMSTALSTILHTFCKSHKRTVLAAAALSLFSAGISNLPTQAAIPVETSSIERSATSLYAMSDSLIGTWRATDASVLQMLDSLYSPSGAAPESITGSVYLAFDGTGGLTVTYDELQMIFPASSGLPPVTLRGSMAFGWAESAGVMSMTGQSYEIEAEVLGMTLPAPSVPMDTTSSGYEIAGELLSFSGFEGAHGEILFPGSWLRTY